MRKPAVTPSYQLWRLPDVEAAVGLKRTAIYDRIGSNEFPAPIKIGGGKASRWRSDEVAAWQDAQPRRRGGAA